MSFDPTWERESQRWARFARSPEHDHFFWRFNGPRFLELLPAPGRRTLDVACGEGRLGRLLSERGHRVVAVDASPSLARMAHEGGRQRVAVAEAARLPLAAGCADLATAFMCLQDIPDLERAVAELARVLEPGGRFCLAVAHPLRSAGGFDGKGTESAFRLESYFERRPWLWRSRHTGLRIDLPGIHRPLEAYTLALERAGFAVEALREPKPTPDEVAGHPRLARWGRVPCFLHLRAVRARAPIAAGASDACD